MRSALFSYNIEQNTQNVQGASHKAEDMEHRVDVPLFMSQAVKYRPHRVGHAATNQQGKARPAEELHNELPRQNHAPAHAQVQHHGHLLKPLEVNGV